MYSIAGDLEQVLAIKGSTGVRGHVERSNGRAALGVKRLQ
jgi:hypothetical protein